jgi:uncharacterized membrane protein YraQ (UPF0718 family)
MDISLWILLALTVGLLVVAFAKDRQLPGQSLLAATKMVRGVWLELALGFVLAGLLEVLIPKPMLATWLGDKELGRSLMVGWGIGLLLPGGPYVLFPAVAGLVQKGAAAGPLICLLSAKTLVSPIRTLTYEAPLLGWQLTLARFIPGVLAPPLLGLIGHWLFGVLRAR